MDRVRDKAAAALLVLLGALATALVAGAGPAEAAIFEVTNTNSAGPGSLERAIEDASYSRADAKVIFAPSVSGTIDLADVLVIERGMEIRGPGASQVTIDGPQQTRALSMRGDFDPNEVFGVDVSISGLTISNGAGAIVLGPQSSLELNRMVLRDNVAANVGGAIVAGDFSHLSIRNSTLSGNSVTGESGGFDSGYGGGIYISSDGRGGSLEIVNSTISGNSAAGSGGGIYADSQDRVEISNSTLTGNRSGSGSGTSARGAAISLSAPQELDARIRSTTIAGNVADGDDASAVDFDYNPEQQTIELSSSILADNTDAAGDPIGCGAGVSDGGDNIGFAAPGCPAGFADVDPGLDPGGLADNGGPTETIAIAPGGAAHDGAGEAPCATGRDQRGVPRPQGFACDVGAFEIDRQDPGAPGIDSGPADGSTVAVDATAFSFSGGGDDVAGYLCLLEGSGVPSEPEPAPCSSPHQLSGLADGTYTFSVRAIDFAGNQGPATARSFGVDTSERTRCNGVPATIVAIKGEPTTGTDGDDVIVGTHTADRIAAGGGDDVVCARAGKDSVRGGAGSDAITGELGEDRLRGGAGADQLYGAIGRDELRGGGGEDKLRGARGGDELRGGGAGDRIRGGRGPDELRGGAGDDRLNGGKGRDSCRGGPGRNRLRNCG